MYSPPTQESSPLKGDRSKDEAFFRGGSGVPLERLGEWGGENSTANKRSIEQYGDNPRYELIDGVRSLITRINT